MTIGHEEIIVTNEDVERKDSEETEEKGEDQKAEEHEEKIVIDTSDDNMNLTHQ